MVHLCCTVKEINRIIRRGSIIQQTTHGPFFPSYLPRTTNTCFICGGIRSQEASSGDVGPTHEQNGDFIALGLNDVLWSQCQATILCTCTERKRQENFNTRKTRDFKTCYQYVTEEIYHHSTSIMRTTIADLLKRPFDWLSVFFIFSR